MLTVAPLLTVVLFVFLMGRFPRPLLLRYRASFRARHGVSVQIGLVVLGTVAAAALIAATLNPGHQLVELVNALVVTGLAIAALVDLHLFDRR